MQVKINHMLYFRGNMRNINAVKLVQVLTNGAGSISARLRDDTVIRISFPFKS